MKQILKQIFPLLALAVLGHSQELRSPLYQNYVTKLQVVNVTAQGVELEWLSDIDPLQPGAFTVYRNATNAISSAALLRDSDLAVPSLFNGVPYQNGLFLYRATVPLPVSGEYYFAVAPSQGLAVDESLRKNLPFQGADFNLLPELSYTIQPVAFMLRKISGAPLRVASQPLSSKILVTSLRLSSEEDVFRLTWTAYPNNRSEYVFYIYRSRYPISDLKFSSPLDLPAYAVVTNKFYFEDQNISFETPYYYAVVSKEAPQWDSGLNVFTTPAVLVRKAPPFTISPQKEYIRRTEEFNVRRSGFLSEPDIEKAVQQTLSNLLIAPNLQGAETAPLQEAPAFNPMPLSPNDFLESPSNMFAPEGLSRSQEPVLRASSGTPILENELLLEGFYRSLAAKYNILVKTESGLKQEALRVDEEGSARFLNEIRSLKQDIASYRGVEDKLASSSSLDAPQSAALAAAYLKKRDQILLKEFTLKNLRQIIPEQREQRRKELTVRLSSLHKSYQTAVERLKARHKAEMKTLLFARIEADRKQKIADQKQWEAQTRIAGLTQRVRGLESSEKVLGLSAAPLRFVAPVQAPPLAEQRLLARLDDPSFYTLPQMIAPVARLQSMDEAFLEEPIPTIEVVQERSRKKEEWLAQKREWLQNNASVWNDNMRFWKESVPAVINDNQKYELLRSRWGNPAPSPSAALQYGVSAYNKGDFAEAAFLLSGVPADDNALMMLGQSFYNLGAYREALSVFASAYKMGIPGSEAWLIKVSQDLVKQKPEQM